MTGASLTFRNGRLFDGRRLHDGLAIRFEGDTLREIGPNEALAPQRNEIDLAGDILCPGYVDLQVNGGDGILFNDDPAPGTLQRIASAHRSLGVTALLPTLITDTEEKTRAAIAAVTDAVAAGMAGIAGLHLEGPHLSVARKGAHDAALIRPMEPRDLAMLLAAAEALPVLKVTLAPEAVSEAQVAELAQAGVLVSLGHTDADHDTCLRYVAAGARVVTHLFNAMSQLGSREPGLVGAALGSGAVSCGLIADGIHVHPQTIRAAWKAKTGPGRIFLVSDAMAVAGSDLTAFSLNGRRIRRRDGRLTLEDGTLAGADLDLTEACRVLVKEAGLPLEAALEAVTSVPAALIGRALPDLVPGRGSLSDVIRIRGDLSGTLPLTG